MQVTGGLRSGETFLTSIQLMEQMQNFCKRIPPKWKVLLGISRNRIQTDLKALKSDSFQPLSDGVRQVVWDWGDAPGEFFDGQARFHSLQEERASATRPLDRFLISVAELQEQGVVDDICRRIWLSCLATLIQRILPEGDRLSRHEEIRNHLVGSGLASPQALSKLKGSLANLYLAGRRWEKYVPLDPEASSAVLSQISTSVRQKTSEVWVGKDGRREPKSANDVVQCLFTYFQRTFRQNLLVVFESGGGQALGNAPAHSGRRRQRGREGNKQRPERSNRESSGPTDNRHRVRKPATPRVERRTATRPTQPRRLTPGPRREQSPTGDSYHTGNLASSRNGRNRPTQNGGAHEGVGDDWNGTVDNTATEHEPSNGHAYVRTSTGQGNKLAAHGSNHRRNPGPTQGAAASQEVLGSGNGIPNDDSSSRPHTNHDGCYQSGQGVQGSINEGSNRLPPISSGNGQQLPPITFVTSCTLRGEDRVRALDNASGSWSHSHGGFATGNLGAIPANHWPMATLCSPPSPTLRALASHCSPANYNVFRVGEVPPQVGDVPREYRPPSDGPGARDSNGQHLQPRPTPYRKTTARPHGYHAEPLNEAGAQSTSLVENGRQNIIPPSGGLNAFGSRELVDSISAVSSPISHPVPNCNSSGAWAHNPEQGRGPSLPAIESYFPSTNPLPGGANLTALNPLSVDEANQPFSGRDVRPGPDNASWNVPTMQGFDSMMLGWTLWLAFSVS
ncbi:hypothetical protein LOZ65_006688 [Ophidiomyces ophidiicola]|nr:hypothetical protein LOZ65_006688 [Ophidiomyces ophidiicola]